MGYDTQKPKALLERIIKMASNKGDLIGDFFCGSGTTPVVADHLKRRYIGCDINSKAIEITKRRLRKKYIPLTKFNKKKEKRRKGNLEKFL
jgi:DNA modification methylase